MCGSGVYEYHLALFSTNEREFLHTGVRVRLLAISGLIIDWRPRLCLAEKGFCLKSTTPDLVHLGLIGLAA